MPQLRLEMPWLPFTRAKLDERTQHAKTTYGTIRKRVDALPLEVILGVTVVSTVGISFVGTKVFRRYFKRIRNSEDVPMSYLAERRWVKGVVTRYV